VCAVALFRFRLSFLRYSCLVQAPLHGRSDAGGILYESVNETIAFSQFPLDFP
jgi:hypothetical protein